VSAQHPEQGLGPARGWLSRVGNHAYGVTFIAVVALLIGLSVATFQKRFTDVVMVDLLTDRVGSQLQAASDVKLRGLIVGEVRSVETTGDGARLRLALQPEMADLIPADVSARLLPKTLFGERYVDLVSPLAGAPAEPIAEGDTIAQDRTAVAIELEQVFEDLLPLLRTVQPEKLAATLNALASALDGRGTRLGENLVLVDRYFREINPRMPAIQADISGLADLASTYAVAAPDLVRAATALVTTNTTIVAKQDELAGFLAGTAGFATTTADFLDANGQRIIQVGKVQRPTLEVFAKYAPQYPCLASGLVDWLPNIDEAWRDGIFHLTIVMAPQREGYQPGEEPRWRENRGPRCYGLPTPRVPSRGLELDDGSRTDRAAAHSALPGMFAGNRGMSIAPVDAGLAGTREEQQVVAALLPGDGRGRLSAITTLLAGPMLRGSVVSQQ
jgi:phospholipid/cholesterol/gamma-HCH transport system substrate-binding protein